jgi:O-Antigen ligase
VPGLHIPGVFNLNRTQLVPRLQDPFGYWNALGLFVAFGVPLALAIVVDGDRRTRMRLGALLSIEVMLLTIGLTYSRGAVLALVGGLAVGIWLSRAKLRWLMWIAAPVLATVPALVFGLASHNLTTVSVGLGSRELAGAELMAVLLISLAALWIGGERLMELERTVQLGPEQTRRIGKGLAIGAAVVVLCGVLAVTVSSRGLTGTVSHAWHTFTKTQETSNYNPGRLLSADSANRWVWWKEAAGAFSDRPLAGWGAGSFPVIHLLYRRNTISVQQPHSVPLQFLAETGIVGALLAIVGFGLLLAVAVRAVRTREGPERLIAAGLIAAVVAYAIHTFYDWDWDIPGVTFPALVLVGVLVGSCAIRRGPALVVGRGVSQTAGVLALSGITALLCAYALSGVVPSVAASKANSALVAASSSSRSALEHAEATARAATRLDPLSDAGLLTSETIALHLGNIAQARTDLLGAIKRDPTDSQAWQQLAFVELDLRDLEDAVTAVQRVAALDPMGRATQNLLRTFESLRAPPSDSATRGPTPISPSQAP